MPERIVVLDGYTLTPAVPGDPCPAGEPSWSPVQALGDLTVYDRTAADQIIERAADASYLLTNKTPLPDETIGQLPGLKYIGVLATGVNVVDLEAAKRAGVVVTNVPGYSGDAVAQHVFALLLALTNRVTEHDRAVHDGQWASCADFCFTLGPIPELAGKTLGIVGAGDIGRRVARIGDAFGMKILVHSRTERDMGVPVEWVGLDDLFKRSDVVTLHAPLTDQTHHLVNADRLGLMKRSAFLVNTGRGPLLDEQAVADALTSGRIAGVAVDVLSTEPPAAANPLLTAPNCLITPHIAWAAVEPRHRLMQIAADNLLAFMDGMPVNVVP
jgi:glycerate dehydrogenase